MPEYKYQVPRIPDSALLDFFRSACKIVGSNSFTFKEVGAARHTTFDITDNSESLKDTIWTSDRYTINSANLGMEGYSIEISRSTGTGADYAFDIINITNNSNQKNQPLYDLGRSRAISALISDTFFSRVENISPMFQNAKSFETLIRSHQSMIERLQRMTLEVGEQASAVRARLEEEYAERNSSLNDEYVQRQTAAEKSQEEARLSITKREEDLEQRKKELDDRDNTHARRNLHKTLKARILERAGKFEITPETKRARLPIHIGAIASAFLLICALVYFTSDLAAIAPNSPTTPIITTAIKPIGLTIALLGLIAWYLRWMNRWFERYADAEFYLKQFELDIDRANWVVETALEWKERQERAIPDPLLESISRNLFSKSERDEDADMHPADYLASAILGRASGVNLKVPGGELTLDNKGIRRLQKDEPPG